GQVSVPPSGQPGCTLDDPPNPQPKQCDPLLPFLRRLLKCDWFLRLPDELLKTRIVTQRIPKWVQTQLAVGDRSGNPYNFFQLFNREIFFADPRIGDCEIC